MASDQEKFEKQERAKRLKAARETAGISGPKGVVDASDGKINENVYKGHESGRNGFTVSDGRAYAELFNVSLVWLYLGIGSSSPGEKMPATVSGEQEIKRLLRRIDKLPPGAVNPVWRVIDGYITDAEQSSPDHPDDQSEPANRRRESTPSE